MMRGAKMFSTLALKKLKEVQEYSKYINDPSKPFFDSSFQYFVKANESFERKDISEAKKFICSALSEADELSGVTPMIMGYIRELCKFQEKIESLEANNHIKYSK